MTLDEQIRELLGLNADGEPLDAVRALKERADAGETAMTGYRRTVKALGAPDDADAAAWTRGEIERLRPVAKDGEQYRTDLIQNALDEGVRAHGEAFALEDYRGDLASMSINAIKRFRDDWKAIGDKTFTGGRLSGDDESGGKPVNLSERRKPSSKRAFQRA